MSDEFVRAKLVMLLAQFLLALSGCSSGECDSSSIPLPGNSYSDEYQNWSPSGVQVRAGDVVSYQASGRVWDGIGAQDGSNLLGQVEGHRFALREGEAIEVPGTGMLFLSISDNPNGTCNFHGCLGPGSCYCDNHGTLCLDIHRHNSIGDAAP